MRTVWSQGIGANFVQKEYFNTNYITGGTVFKKTILNDYNLSATSDVTSMQVGQRDLKYRSWGAYSCVGMQITVVRSGSSCPLGEVLEHSEKVGPRGGGSICI